MRAFSAALFLLPLIALQNAGAVSPEDCDATEPFAAKVLDLINKERRHGYLFQLLRVADAHLDKVVRNRQAGLELSWESRSPEGGGAGGGVGGVVLAPKLRALYGGVALARVSPFSFCRCSTWFFFPSN